MKSVLLIVGSLLALLFLFHVSHVAADTIGYSTIGASIQNAGSASGSNNPGGLLVTFPSAAQVTKLTAYVRMTSTTRSVTASIYAGSAGSRGALVKTSSASSVTSTPGWVDFTFATAANVTATTYWIQFDGYGGDGPGTSFAQINYDTGGASNTGYVVNDLGTPVYNTQKASIYATYTPSAASSFYNGMVMSSAF